MNVTGYARDIEVKPSFDTNVIAYYRNHENKSMMPFAIERLFTNSGRIIYVNSQGYFEAVYNNPKKILLPSVIFRKYSIQNPPINQNR